MLANVCTHELCLKKTPYSVLHNWLLFAIMTTAAFMYLLIASSSAVLRSGIQSPSCQLSQIDGVISDSFVQQNISARSAIDCFVSSCDCFSRCILSFHHGSGVCLSTPLSALPLDWMRQCDLLTTSKDSAWSSYVPNEILEHGIKWKRPSGLWLLDKAFRGCNLGSKGRLLDASNVRETWTVAGPRTSSHAKYMRFDASFYPVIQILHGNKSLINFAVRTTFLDPALGEDRQCNHRNAYFGRMGRIRSALSRCPLVLAE